MILCLQEKAALPIELQSGVGHSAITPASPETTSPGFRKLQLQALERRVKAALVERASMIAWAAGYVAGHLGSFRPGFNGFLGLV